MTRLSRRAHAIALTSVAVATSLLGGCASNVKGSWACAVERGSVCASITDIDRAQSQASASKRGRRAEPDPVIDGAIPARLIGEGGWTAGSIAGAPIREGDPTVRIAIAPWIDAPGDYHAGSEVYAVMRHGQWYARPPASIQRVELDGAPTQAPRAPASDRVAPTSAPAATAHASLSSSTRR